MSWNRTSASDEKLRFIGEYLKHQDSVSDLCHAFGISRKTAYKLIRRYHEAGFEGLSELSRRPGYSPQAASDEVVALLVEARQAHPRWGPKKIRARLAREHPDVKLPALSTIGAILKRFGLVTPRKRRNRVARASTTFADCNAPNDVWCADFKGWFHAADGNRCEPLTISDAYSRLLLKCRIVPNTRFTSVRPVLEAAFRQFGLPKAIRTDNGPPFASVGLAGLSSFTIWLTRLGIVHERIEPGHPEQNGRHERMHRTLKQETALPPRATLGQQQYAFDAFRDEFNTKRPHEALGHKMPAEVYQRSERPYPDVLPEIVYPVAFVTRPIKKAGQFFWNGERVYAHRVLNGESIGLEQMTPRYWRVWFGPIQIAVFDEQRLKLIAMSPVYDRRSPQPTPESVPEPGLPHL